MGVFDSVVDGVNAAVMLQQTLAEANRTNPDSLELRVGLSVDEVSTEAGDVFGTAVIEAARLCAETNPRRILSTSMLRALHGIIWRRRLATPVRTKLKGLVNPASAVEVTWVPFVEPTGIVCDFAHADPSRTERFVECLDRQQQPPFFAEVRQHLLELLTPQPGQTLLDVGCGAGYDVIELARLVGDDGLVIGLEKSEAMLDVARTRPDDHEVGNVEFRLGDAQDLLLDDDSVDGARSDRVFQIPHRPCLSCAGTRTRHPPRRDIVIADTDWGGHFRCRRSPGLGTSLQHDWGR